MAPAALEAGDILCGYKLCFVVISVSVRRKSRSLSLLHCLFRTVGKIQFLSRVSVSETAVGAVCCFGQADRCTAADFGSAVGTACRFEQADRCTAADFGSAVGTACRFEQADRCTAVGTVCRFEQADRCTVVGSGSAVGTVCRSGQEFHRPYAAPA